MMARPTGRRPRKVIADAVRRYMAGDPVDDIAKEVGVTQPTVSYWMKRHGKRFGKDAFKRRTRGRRKDMEPNERDKKIIYLHNMGMPAAHLALEHDIKRSRASYIVKLWRERGYVPPPPPYKAGDIVRFADGEFRLDEIKDTTSAVATLLRQLVPPDKDKGETEGHWQYVEEGEVSDPFCFYKNGEWAKVIQTA